MKIVLFLAGVILGGMFMDAKLAPKVENTSETEIVYGTRIGPSGQLMLVTK